MNNNQTSLIGRGKNVPQNLLEKIKKVSAKMKVNVEETEEGLKFIGR